MALRTSFANKENRSSAENSGRGWERSRRSAGTAGRVCWGDRAAGMTMVAMATYLYCRLHSYIERGLSVRRCLIEIN